MFTEGLDRSALRWVKEKKEVPLSATPNLGSQIDPMITHIRSGSNGKGFGLPPASKFRSGHLPSNAIPLPQAIPGNSEESGSASENDMITDSEDDMDGGSYSLDSSPQDERAPSAARAQSYGKPTNGRPNNSTDFMYSDISSSMDTVARGNERYPVGQNGYAEDELSDSAGSSEFSTSQAGGGSISSAVLHGRAYASEGYDSRVQSKRNLGSNAEKGLHARTVQSEKLPDDVDVPSAPPFSGAAQEIKQNEQIPSGIHRTQHATTSSDQCARTTDISEAAASSCPARVPTFYASALGPWHGIIAYDACVRLCLHAWAMECMEAPMFLENECALLRDSFNLRQVLLQSEEELLAKRTSELANEKAAPKPKKIVGKMKVQVCKIKAGQEPPTGCSIMALRPPSIKLEVILSGFSTLQSRIMSGWQALRNIHVAARVPANGSFPRQSLAYVHAGTQYIKQVSGLLKTGVTTLRSSSSSYEVVQETYSCLLRLKSSAEEDVIKMQPGSGETHVFFPESLGDELIVEVLDSKTQHFGRVHAQVATISDDPADKQRWFSVYREPEHELVGKIQLSVYYSTSSDETPKCGSVAETVAYDIVLEVAMKVQHFRQRSLLLHGPWKWLLTEFASYYGVSDVYTKLRYLSYIMDVATPTADCLNLVYDLLKPVLMKGHNKSMLSFQENRILGETKDQIERILALVFENYKSLDETTLSGVMEVFRPATGHASPALEPAVKLYTLLHDVLSPEVQTALCHYFQVAVRKRSRRHLSETDEYTTNNSEGILSDPLTITTAYHKMKSLCINIRNEIQTDIEIHNQHVLPSFIDLPHLASSIYSTELCSRLRAFLIACPPSGPSPPVAELIIATADFQRDLASWKISNIKAGVDAKELFHLYIMLWIEDKRQSLLEVCKLDKVKWSGVKTRYSTTPFVDEMYERLKETLSDYEVIICRWPEYTFALESAIADIEKAIIESLDKQYADVLAPLKENLAPKKFGLKYVQKLAKRSVCSYTVPEELGILSNSLKRMLDVLRPQIEVQFRSWASCIPDGGQSAPGDRLSEVTVMLRAKFRNYLQAVVEKLVENTKLQSATKLKKILQDSKETVVESAVRSRMEPLKDQLTSTINHLHTVLETHVFVAVCRGYWDRMGQDVLSFLENRKENRSWYKGSRIAVSVLDDTFASQMQQLLGNTLLAKDLESPRCITEVRSILCKDTAHQKENSYYF